MCVCVCVCVCACADDLLLPSGSMLDCVPSLYDSFDDLDADIL